MTLSKLLLPLLVAGNLSSAWAIGRVVPSSTTSRVTADETLKGKLPLGVAKRGYIVAGANPNTSPTTLLQEGNKTLAGCEVDAMNVVATGLGVEVRWRDTGGFDNIIPGLESGRYDVVLSNINATKKRLEQVDFVSHYDTSRPGAIPRKDADIALFTSFEAVCGQEVGIGAGTTQIGRPEVVSKVYTDAGKPPAKIAVFLDHPSGVQATVSGRVLMFFGPCEGLTYQVSQVKSPMLTGAIHVDDAPVSMAFPKQSGLEEAVQASLNSLIEDGTYQKTLDKRSIGFSIVEESKCSEEIFG